MLHNDLIEDLIDENSQQENLYQKAINTVKKFFNISVRSKTDNKRKLEVCFQFLQTNLHDNTDLIIEFLFKVNNDFFISRLLYGLQNWENPRVYELLEKHHQLFNKDNWSFYHLLENILNYDPEYVFNKIKPLVVSDEVQPGNHQEHQLNEILKKLIEKLPVPVLDFFIERIEHDIEAKQYESEFTDLIVDFAVNEIDLRDDENLSGKGYVYQLSARTLRKQASEESEYFKQFLSKYKNSKFKGILKFVVFSLQTNEQKYASVIFDLLNYLSSIKFFDSGGRLNFEVRNLLRQSFIYFNNSQKNGIIEIIKGLKVYKEMYVWKDNAGKKKITFLSRANEILFTSIVFPQNVISGDPLLSQGIQGIEQKICWL